ncbi:MAG: NHL repeat-containing protein [Thermoanaerobaculia bacterium]|nr:NHL repeat-containing protein [Thermoanaerobaculia bacterium]
MNAFRRLAVACVVLMATALHAAEMQTFTLRPVLFIETHLYDGHLRAPEGIFVDDARKEILVADSRNNLIGIFGFDGMPLFAFGSTKYIREPRQVAVDPGGRILVLERDRTKIRLFNYRGVYLGDLVPPSLPGKGRIAAFAFGPNGLFYVAETGSGEMLVYDYAAMTLKRRFGSSGDEEGQFQSVASIAADEKYIYVLDYTGLAVQVFTQRGDFVKGWGKHSMGGANFSLPHSIAVDPKGRIVTVDGLRHDIKYFNLEGEMIGHFGGPGISPGRISFPTGVAVDASGRVYVSERGNSRVQVYEEETLEKPVPVP